MKENRSEILTLRLTPSERDDLRRLANLCRDDETTMARKAILELIAYAKAHHWRVSFPIVLDTPPPNAPESAESPSQTTQKKKAA